MRKIAPLFLLLVLPVFAGLEVTSSELVSRRPDGLGVVKEADLDGDGDRDFLITGRNNDFLGWVEVTANGPTGQVRPIQTGNLAIRGQRPMVADLEGDGLPDIHFPGWVLKNRNRRFDPPAPLAATAGHELCADDPAMLLARATDTGEWRVLDRNGTRPMLTPAGVLKSPASFPETCAIFGRGNLFLYLENAIVGTAAVTRGSYGFGPLQEGGYDSPVPFSTANPLAVSTIWNSYGQKSSGLVVARETIADYPPPLHTSGSSVRVYFFYPSRGFNQWESNGGFSFTGQKVSALTAANSIEPYGLSIAIRYASLDGQGPHYIQRILTSTAGGPGMLEAAKYAAPVDSGSGEIFLSTDTKSIITAMKPQAGDTQPAPDALLSYKISNLDPEQAAQGGLAAGPFGPLTSGTWADFDGDGRDERVAATAWPGAAIAIPTATPANVKAIPLDMPPYIPWMNTPITLADGPIFAGDLDGDGDIDLARALKAEHEEVFPYRVLGKWENSGGMNFSRITNYPYDSWGDILWPEMQPLRVDTHGPPRLFSATSGLIQTHWLGPISQQYLGYPTHEIYPGTTAKVVQAQEDIDGDGAKDFVFFPSAFGNKLAWAKWNAEGSHFDSLQSISSHPATTVIDILQGGDLDGDGTRDLFHAQLDESGTQVHWVAVRMEDGTLSPLSYPAATLPESAHHALPADVDGDGDMDLIRFIDDVAGEPDPGGALRHFVRWSEQIGGLWIHHATELGTLRLPPVEVPALSAENTATGARLLMMNGIGDVLEIRTAVSASTGAMAGLLATKGLTGCSSGCGEDPDGDGIPNYAEILAGSSPVVADSSFAVPLKALRAGESSGWVATLPVSLEEYGIGARIETSVYLDHWTRHDQAPLPLGATAEGHRYLFTDAGISSSGNRFVRIVFDQP